MMWACVNSAGNRLQINFSPLSVFYLKKINYFLFLFQPDQTKRDASNGLSSHYGKKPFKIVCFATQLHVHLVSESTPGGQPLASSHHLVLFLLYFLTVHLSSDFLPSRLLPSNPPRCIYAKQAERC